MTTPKFVIRAAVKDDAKNLMQMVKHLLEYEYIYDVDLGTIDDFRQEIEGGNFLCYVVDETSSNATVAMSIFFPVFSFHEDRRIHIEGLFVEEQWRDQGLCSSLLITIGHMASSLPSKQISLQTLDWNEKAWHKFQSLGFKHWDDNESFYCLNNTDLKKHANNRLPQNISISSLCSIDDHNYDDAPASVSDAFIFLIRPFTLSDNQTVIDYIMGEDSMVDRYRLEDNLQSGEVYGLVVEERSTGQLKGLCLYTTFYSMVMKTRVKIEWFHVFRSARRLGICRSVLTVLCRVALSKKWTDILIDHSRNDDKTISVFSHLGFKKLVYGDSLHFLNWRLNGENFNRLLERKRRYSN